MAVTSESASLWRSYLNHPHPAFGGLWAAPGAVEISEIPQGEMKMTEKSFDIAILGGGPGGYTAAIRAAQLGMTVALVEKGFLGGTCLNRGCIPSKAFIRCASLLEDIKGAKTFGVSASDVSFDWSKILKYKDRCVIRLRKGTESLMPKNKIEVFSSNGVLTSVDMIQTDQITVKAKNIILATGSVPRSLPSLPVDGEFIINSDHALELSSLPKSLLVVGAGAIGCEFAYVMSVLGVDATIVEFLDRALPMEDEEISKEYESELKRRKIKLYVRSSVEKIEMITGGVRSHVKPRDGGEEFTIDAEKVLVSVGRKAASENCGLEEAGIPIEKGFVKVDGFMKTGVGNIRAIGDLVGGLMLAHKAAAEGILAVEDIAGIQRLPLKYANIPRATYTRPEVASVGYNESEARIIYGEKVRIGKFPFTALAKAFVHGHTTGFVKFIAAGDEGKLVGAHAIGANATDLIAIASTAIGSGLTAEDFAHIVQAHPTLGEIWHEAAHGCLDGTINF